MGLVLLWFESRMSPTGLCLGFSDSSLWDSAVWGSHTSAPGDLLKVVEPLVIA